MNAALRLHPRAKQRLRELDRVLDQTYGVPESLLGNQSDPLDEAVYIILSFQTDLARFKETWAELRSAFPRWEDLEAAPLTAVEDVLRAGGLHRQKARVIKRLLRAVREQMGELSLEALRDMPDIEAERLLTQLPGLSWKGTRCVLLYSLHRQVLPVDGNTFRILKRAGVLPKSAVYRWRSLHDGVQEAVDPPRRRSFHVNLVIHGQRVCLPRAPNCPECPAQAVCAMRGLPRAVVKAARSGAPLARGARASGGHRLDEQTSSVQQSSKCQVQYANRFT